MITMTAPVGGVVSGLGVLIGSRFGVAAFAAEGADAEIATVGVFDLPKAPAAVIAQGIRVTWDDTRQRRLPSPASSSIRSALPCQRRAMAPRPSGCDWTEFRLSQREQH